MANEMEPRSRSDRSAEHDFRRSSSGARNASSEEGTESGRPRSGTQAGIVERSRAIVQLEARRSRGEGQSNSDDGRYQL